MLFNAYPIAVAANDAVKYAFVNGGVLWNATINLSRVLSSPKSSSMPSSPSPISKSSNRSSSSSSSLSSSLSYSSSDNSSISDPPRIDNNDGGSVIAGRCVVVPNTDDDDAVVGIFVDRVEAVDDAATTLSDDSNATRIATMRAVAVTPFTPIIFLESRWASSIVVARFDGIFCGDVMDLAGLIYN